MHAIIMLLLGFMAFVGVVQGFSSTGRPVARMPMLSGTDILRRSPHILLSKSEAEEDDGWGDDEPSATGGTVQERELAALRSQMAQKQEPAFQNSNISRNEEPERDLFIPIFAVVSLAGLFGAYGYEMLRLYSRGELYLPWDQ